jgi:hypothetical protein
MRSYAAVARVMITADFFPSILRLRKLFPHGFYNDLSGGSIYSCPARVFASGLMRESGDGPRGVLGGGS